MSDKRSALSGRAKRGGTFAGLCVAILGLAAFLGGSAAPAAAGEACPNETVRSQQASTFLPDCRAYEMVSVPDKNGQDAVVPGLSEDGEAAFYNAASGFGPEPSGGGTAYVARRTSAGWSSTNILGAQPTVTSSVPIEFAGPSFAEITVPAVAFATATTPSQRSVLHGPTGDPTTTLDSIEGGLTTSSLNTPPVAPPVGQSYFYSGNYELDPAHGNLQSDGNALYEYREGGIHLVSLNNAGTAEVSECGADLGSPSFYAGYKGVNPVSADGARVVFTSPSYTNSGGAGCSEPRQVYVRIKTPTGYRTVWASKPTNPAAPPATEAWFVGASDDGSKVFFRSAGRLTPDVPESLTSEQLYEYEVPASGNQAEGTLKWISQVPAPNDGTSLVAISPDGSHVYYEVTVPLGEFHTFDLYKYTGGTNELIASHVTQEGENANAQFDRTSADGSKLAFTTQAQLTSVPNEGSYELYQYREDASPNWICASCTATGNGGVEPSYGTAGQIGENQPRVMSADGSYMFFTSQNALLPQDTNGANDVYEWHNGVVSLISSGRGKTGVGYSQGAEMAGSTADGSEVLFLTPDPLVAQDRDNLRDAYVARIDGGFAEPPAAASCEGPDCLGAQPEAPGFVTPGTPGFVGRGNAKPGPRRCIRHKRRHGKARSCARHRRRHKGHRRRKGGKHRRHGVRHSPHHASHRRGA